MKPLFKNLRSWSDFLNLILMSILLFIVYSTNGIQHLKLWYYKLLGVDCIMYVTDPKFGIKRCRRK